SLLTSDLWIALRQLRSRGVEVINGPIVLDDSLFPPANSSLSEEAFDEAPHRAYHAQPNALLLNMGSMAIELQVSQDAVRIVPDEAPRDWAFVSEVRLVEGACGAWKNGMSVGFAKAGPNVVVTVKGNYPRRCGQATLPIRIPVQDWLWESWMREIWPQLGGRFGKGQGGQVQKGITPAGTVALYTHAGKPLHELIRQINKWSSNVMARHLELAVARNSESFDREMKDWLKGQGIGVQDWFFENGSGLSRTTRVDAKGLAEFLRYMAQRPEFPDYLASFPRAGVDGTLQRRVSNLDGFAYLKTGSLNGVRSVGGYLRDRRGQMWAIGIFVESPRAQESWPAMESLLEFVYRPD
ncbi:MAG TPA: D-alanyl-D-alanine carboxypeptidase/D-alanyl-D-alanine-endopeptidase, partial [Limnobacter sp.]|nr:D-alanyl-D-alanine carboxypeptidase/D-alanyl-D-alanine-endopeptidase [Limnobacter sp.]